MHHSNIPNFLNTAYLLAGTPKQQEVFHALHDAHVFASLADYSSVLAGTIPLGIETSESDADILCEVRNHQAFRELLRISFGTNSDFVLWNAEKQGLPTTLASFSVNATQLLDTAKEKPLRVEIFGQNKPVEEQNGYRHLVVEARLIALAETLLGEKVKEDLRAIKLRGTKTEPAFAEYFGIAGEPYQALLELYDAEEEKLHEIVLKSVRQR
ncbi:MAG: DUF4269 domain-containing protein [Candidatus Kapabacteria bacterium]|jgi:hypothetical protein|nr:DUF4269 domain-containing protein [Candidatus Kapabacteria bacterium]